MQYLSRLSVFMLLAVMVACALSPQRVAIRPQIDPSGANAIGNEAAVSLQIVDNRPSRIIGTRGGIYASTSEISTVEDIRTPIRTELASALRTLGYKVVEDGQAADAELKILIDAIEYTNKGGTVTKSIETVATVRAVCKVGNREYTGRYRGMRTEKVLTVPDAEENEAMVNAALSQVLKRMLADQQLLEFMRG